LGTARDWAIDFAVAATIGLFVGVIGPYGSYLNGAPGRASSTSWSASAWEP
jgi:hypothetical protein